MGGSGYRFLDNPNSFVWDHEIHNHGAGDFGYGERSTSHIEHTWNNIKQEIKLIYGSIPHKNFIYFFREVEFSLNISTKNSKEKLNIFRKILEYVYNLNEFDFYNEEEIKSFDNYDI